MASLVLILSACGDKGDGEGIGTRDDNREYSDDSSSAQKIDAQLLSLFSRLAAGADHICTGTVSRIDSFITKNEQGDEFVISDVTFTVESDLLENLSEDISFRALGGTIGGRRYIYSISPDFFVGRRSLLFLKRDGEAVYPYLFKNGEYRIDEKNILDGTDIDLETAIVAIEELLR